MKKATKTLLLMLCAVVLVVSSILGTVAYLTSTDEVTNTFSVGKVTITMDETDVDLYGVKDSEARVKKNDYKLIPGHVYTKDPTIYVADKSEPCYLFVKVENDIAAFEKAGETTIAKQLEAKNWKPLGVTDVYYYDAVVDARNGAVTIKVFENFTIAGDADTNDTTKAAWAAVTSDTTVTVTAYAVQSNGFSDAADAWNTSGVGN